MWSKNTSTLMMANAFTTENTDISSRAALIENVVGATGLVLSGPLLCMAYMSLYFRLCPKLNLVLL